MERLDVYLTKYGLTRSYAAKLIAAGRVKVDGAAVTKSSFLLPDACDVTYEDFVPEVTTLRAEEIPLAVLYEDDDFLVIDKPRGMVVHPSKGHADGTVVNALLGYMGENRLSAIGGEYRPGIVHRLDKDTSGLLLVAKNDFAHGAVSKLLESRKVERVYTALAHGTVESACTVCAAIARDRKNRLKMAVVHGGSGREAITHFSPVRRYRKFTLVEARLETGRTHQIRLHLSHIGHPVVGDPLYGRGTDQKAFGSGQVLHATTLRFSHPRTGCPICVESPLPAYFEEAVALAERM